MADRFPAFPHSLFNLPRPGNREIRTRGQPLLPRIRNERKDLDGNQKPI